MSREAKVVHIIAISICVTAFVPFILLPLLIAAGFLR